MALSGYMLYTLWLIIALIGIDILAGLYRALTNHSFSFGKLASFLPNAILFSVFPLLLLTYLDHVDPTGWFVKIMYYLGALGIVVKYLTDISEKLRK
jgi:hypothetical protein